MWTGGYGLNIHSNKTLVTIAKICHCLRSANKYPENEHNIAIDDHL